MTAALRIDRLEHADPAVAQRIHAIQMAAYAQEAALLGVRWFPPLERTPDDVQSSPETFFGALVDGRLVGAVSVEPGEQPGAMHIASLVVAPDHQRRGTGRALVSEVLRRFPGSVVTVSTGAANAPACELYAGLGFVEESRRTIGPESLVLVRLRREP